MSRKLVCHAEVVVTMDSKRREIPDGAVYIEGNVIKEVGTTEQLEGKLQDKSNLEIIDAKGCVVLPGLINCHHHLNETLTRAYATGPGLSIMPWLKKLDPFWSENTNNALYIGAKAALCELILSGATTVADENFPPRKVNLDVVINAAQELGVRFHAIRGFMESGLSQNMLENYKEALEDCERLIKTYHNPSKYSMMRVGIGPAICVTNTKEGYIESARLARSYENVLLHTHFKEAPTDERDCLELHNCTTSEFMKATGWHGKDVWFAHCVHLDDADINFIVETNTGVSYNASSNMILGSGIPPILKLLDRGVRVGIGVDGSASSDSNNLLAEARQAMLLQRVQQNADKMSARKTLELATRGGASLLNRDDIGSLESGKAADLVAFRVDGLPHAGAQGDIVSALLTCAPVNAWLSIINGETVVENGKLKGVDLDDVVKRCNEACREIFKRANEKLSKL